MTNKPYFLVTLLLIISACSQQKNTIEINLDYNNINSISLKEIGEEITIKPLITPENIFFGDISRVKKNGKRLYLLDQTQTHTITVFDEDGQFLRQLNEKGDSPENYDVIEDFAIDNESKRLIVYDRNSFKLLFYDLDKFEFIKQVKLNFAMKAFEVFDEKHLLGSIDSYDENGDIIGICLISSSTGDIIKSQMPVKSHISIKASESIMFSKQQEILFYSLPYVHSELYKSSIDGMEKILEVNFNQKAIEEKHWELNPGDFIRIPMKEDKAFAAHTFLINENTIWFWYMAKGFRKQNLVKHNKLNNRTEIFDIIRYTPLKNALTPPNLVDNDRFYHVISQNLLSKKLLKETNIFSNSEDFENFIKSENPFILSYRVN